MGGTIGAKKILDFVAVAGAAHTLRAQDLGKVILFNSAAAVTLTLPQRSSLALGAGYQAQFRNQGAGQITLATQGADVLSGAGALTGNAHKISAVYLETAGAPNTWVSVGDLS